VGALVIPRSAARVGQVTRAALRGNESRAASVLGFAPDDPRAPLTPPTPTAMLPPLFRPTFGLCGRRRSESSDLLVLSLPFLPRGANGAGDTRAPQGSAGGECAARRRIRNGL